MKKKVVPKLRQEVKVKVDIVTCDDIKIYYIGKFHDFTARYIITFVIFFSDDLRESLSFNIFSVIGAKKIGFQLLLK